MLLISNYPQDGLAMRLFKSGTPIPNHSKHFPYVPDRKYVLAVDEQLRLIAFIAVDSVRHVLPFDELV